MGLPRLSISGSARAHSMLVLAGAAPARTGTARPSLPFAAAGGRFAGGGRGAGAGHGEHGGGGARIAGAAMCAALRRPAAPAFKNASFPSSGGAAVLCLARGAEGEGDGYRGVGGVGAGAGDDEDGDGGAGAGGDGHGDGVNHCNAKKGYDLNNSKGAEGAPAGFGGGDGNDHGDGDAGAGGDGPGDGVDHCNKGFDLGPKGAPAGVGGGDGDVGAVGNTEGGAGAGKACDFNKDTEAAAAASGGGDHRGRADQACWEPMSLRWAFVQAFITVFVLGCSVCIAFKLWFDITVKKLLKAEEMRILVAEAIQGIVWHTTKPINPVVRWKEMRARNKFLYGGICSFCLYHFLRSLW